MLPEPGEAAVASVESGPREFGVSRSDVSAAAPGRSVPAAFPRRATGVEARSSATALAKMLTLQDLLHAFGAIETTRSWLLMAVRLSPTVTRGS